MSSSSSHNVGIDNNPPSTAPISASSLKPIWLAHLQDQLDQYQQRTDLVANRQLMDDYSSLLTHALNLVTLNTDLKYAFVNDTDTTPSTHPSRTPQSSHDTKLTHLLRDKERLQSDHMATLQQFKQCRGQLASQERTSRKLTTEVSQLKATVRDLNIKLHDATHLITTKDTVIMIAQDELTATQIELLTKERRLTELEKENRELLDRWLALKAQQAVQLNNEPARSVSDRLLGGTFRAIGSLISGGSTSSTSNTSSVEFVQRPWPPRSVNEAVTVPTRLVRTIDAHHGEAYCLATSFDGALVASGGDDKVIHIWSPANAMSHLASITGVLGSVLALSFSPVSSMLAAGSSDNAVRVYLPTSPTASPPTRLVHTFTGHMGKVTGVAVSGRETILASCSGDRTLKIWDMEKAYCMSTLFAFSACTDLNILDFSVATLVSAHLDGKIRVWDTSSTTMVSEIVQCSTSGIAVVSVKVLDFNTVISLSRDNVIRVVDLRQARVASSIDSNVFRVGNTRVSLSPGGRFVAAGAADGSVFGWDLRSLEPTILTGGHGTQVNEVSWNPHDSTFLYSIDKCGHLTTWGV